MERIISTDFSQQRRDFFTIDANGMIYPEGYWRDLQKTANYYAPGHWTMFSYASGDQSQLFESRWRDSVLWSIFLSRSNERFAQAFENGELR